MKKVEKNRKTERPSGKDAPSRREEPSLSELLRQVKYGGRDSSAAFARLREKYAPLLASEVDSFRQDPAFSSCDREDLLQEASIVLLLAARRFDETQTKVTFGLYLKICLRNAMISKQRHLRSVQKKQSRLAGEGTPVYSEAEAFAAVFLPDDRTDGGSGDALFLDDFDERTALRRVAKLFREPLFRERQGQTPSLEMLQKELLPLLTAYEREVFRRFYSGQSYEKIAGELARSRKSVDNALSRIREKWRRQLREGAFLERFDPPSGSDESVEPDGSDGPGENGSRR